MDLWSVAKVIGRQWLVLAVSLLIVVGIVGAMAWKLPTTYSAKATMLLLPPRAGGTYQPGLQSSTAPTPPLKVVNPYLSFDNSIYVLANVLVQDLNADEMKNRLQEEGETAKYDVTSNSNEPAVTVVATDSDRRQALQTANAVVDHLQTDLADRQRVAGLPEGIWVTATPLARPQGTEEANSKQKVVLAVLGLGVLAALSLVFIAESLGIGHRRVVQRRVGGYEGRDQPAGEVAQRRVPGPPPSRRYSSLPPAVKAAPRRPDAGADGNTTFR